MLVFIFIGPDQGQGRDPGGDLGPEEDQGDVQGHALEGDQAPTQGEAEGEVLPEVDQGVVADLTAVAKVQV